MHIFKYSKRKGTPAARMENQVDDTIKAKRSDILIALNDKQNKEYKQSFLGTAEDVLFEEVVSIDGNELLVGYTREYVKVGISAINVENVVGKIETVTIVDDNGEILLARK